MLHASLLVGQRRTEPGRLNNILLPRAEAYYKIISGWRAANPGHQTDVPVRALVTAVAQNTWSIAKTDPTLFNDGLSVLYLTPGLDTGDANLHGEECDHAATGRRGRGRQHRVPDRHRRGAAMRRAISSALTLAAALTVERGDGPRRAELLRSAATAAHRRQSGPGGTAPERSHLVYRVLPMSRSFGGGSAGPRRAAASTRASRRKLRGRQTPAPQIPRVPDRPTTQGRAHAQVGISCQGRRTRRPRRRPRTRYSRPLSANGAICPDRRCRMRRALRCPAFPPPIRSASPRSRPIAPKIRYGRRSMRRCR